MRLPAATDLQTRDGTMVKDGRMLNCFAEIEDGIARAVKRPGLVNRYSLVLGHATAPLDARGQGLISWTTPAGVSTLVGIRGDTLTRGVV